MLIVCPSLFQPKSCDPAVGHNKSRASYLSFTCPTTAPLTRAQIETDFLFTSVFVELNYRIQEKKIADALCWLQGKVARVLGEEEYFNGFYLAQLDRAIQYQTNALHQVWNNIARLRSTYESSEEEE
jgi:hypothetical protein